MSDSIEKQTSKNIFADGSFITIIFAILIVVGVWSYINEIKRYNTELNVENDVLLKKVIDQKQLIDSMSMYLEMQPYIRKELLTPKDIKYM